MLEQLKELRLKALNELSRVGELEELESWRIHYLSKKSKLTQVLRSLANLSLEERKKTGALANEVKLALESGLVEKEKSLKEIYLASFLGQKGLDITLPGRPIPVGRLHPITQALEEICNLFTRMGFQVTEGPDVEWDYYNFEALNIPPDHPARDMFATLWIDST